MEEKKQSEEDGPFSNKRLVHGAAFLLIIAHLALLATSAARKSHTSDEPFHLARGMAALLTGDFRTSVAHPPIINMMSALPVVLAYDFQIPTEHPVWTNSQEYKAPVRKIALAEHFLRENPHYRSIVFLGRVPVMVLSAVLALVLYIFAARRFGTASGLMAMALYVFSPTMLAHARLTTTDTGAALFTLLFAMFFCRYLERPRYHNLALTAAAFGLAQLSKYSSVLLIPAVPLVLIIERKRLREKKEELKKSGYKTACPGWVPASLLVYIGGALVLWAGYGFEVRGFHELAVPENIASLGTPGLFVKQTMVKALAFLNPPPPTYFFGLSETLLDTAAHPKPLYFLGNISKEGWWYYYPVLFLIKEPLALLALVVVGAATFRKAPSFSRPEKTVALTITMIFLFTFMFLNQKNIGIRHLLPLYPFLFLWLSRLAAVRARRGALPLGAWILVAALAVRALIIHPDYLVHFNCPVGGPEGGLRLSVVGEDWGQDVSSLGKFCKSKGIERIYYEHYGTADPKAYGVPWVKYECDMDAPGWYAIHVVHLRRPPVDKPEGCYDRFRENEPEARLHHTIYVYHLEKKE